MAVESLVSSLRLFNPRTKEDTEAAITINKHKQMLSSHYLMRKHIPSTEFQTVLSPRVQNKSF